MEREKSIKKIVFEIKKVYKKSAKYMMQVNDNLDMSMHLLLGNTIYKKLPKDLIKRRSFLFGNIKPDIRNRLHPWPHSYERSANRFLDELHTICVRISEGNMSKKQFSSHLGVLCHYIADFFTFPHSERYDKRPIRHYMYEKGMSFAYFFKRRHIPFEYFRITSFSEAVDVLNNLRARYAENMDCYLKDFVYACSCILSICMFVMGQ
jgi:hypothetical protein